ncbi:uncharacterized protein LOC117249182 isoform X2 [Epinephelus lanceolatus]
MKASQKAQAVGLWQTTGGQALYRAKKLEEVDAEAWVHVNSEGGDTTNATLVLSRWKVQFVRYQGKTFHWLLENDVGYVVNLVASHQKERERTRSQSPLMANKICQLPPEEGASCWHADGECRPLCPEQRQTESKGCCCCFNCCCRCHHHHHHGCSHRHHHHHGCSHRHQQQHHHHPRCSDCHRQQQQHSLCLCRKPESQECITAHVLLSSCLTWM